MNMLLNALSRANALSADRTVPAEAGAEDSRAARPRAAVTRDEIVSLFAAELYPHR